jgi:hypothetical protein
MASKRMEAAERGDIKFQSSPCRVCGSLDRYVMSGACVECAKSRNRDYSTRIKQAIAEGRKTEAQA